MPALETYQLEILRLSQNKWPLSELEILVDYLPSLEQFQIQRIVGDIDAPSLLQLLVAQPQPILGPIFQPEVPRCVEKYEVPVYHAPAAQMLLLEQ